MPQRTDCLQISSERYPSVGIVLSERLARRSLDGTGENVEGQSYCPAAATIPATIFLVSSSIALIGSFDPVEALDIPRIPTYTAS